MGKTDRDCFNTAVTSVTMKEYTGISGCLRRSISFGLERWLGGEKRMVTVPTRGRSMYNKAMSLERWQQAITDSFLRGGFETGRTLNI